MRTTFQQFTIDSDTRQLLHNGSEIHLSPKAFDLLCLLVARRPNVVGKEELLHQVWPDSYVSDANLNVLVGEVRKAVGDTAQSPRFIRTVHGVGYAFSADAINVDSSSPSELASRTRFRLVGRDRTFVLFEGDNVIGRDPQCTIWLDDVDVSRRHARIHVSAQGTVFLDDLDSTNGTLLGRSRLKTQTPLSDGDVIRVGPVELRFRDAFDTPQKTRRIRRKTG